MAKWKTPKITIGGIPVLAQEFSWALTAGVLPYETSIILLNDITNEKLKKIKNPTNLNILVTGGSKGEPETVRMKFEKIYIVEPKAVDPYHTMWTISDSRFSMRGLKLFTSYNKTRIKNQSGTGVTAASDNPALLRQPFDRFSKGRYIPWSVKPDGKPYDMKEIVELELTKLNIPFDSTVSNNKGAYIVENVELEGVPIYNGLENLLSRSRLSMGILPNGKLYVYSLDFFDESQVKVIQKLQGQKRKRPGVLYEQDMKRVRPPKIKVIFERKIETRVIAQSSEDTNLERSLPISPNPPVWDQKDIDEWRAIGCENVLRVPYPFTSVITGKIHQIGEFVPMWEYLKSIGLSETDVREKWFSSILEFKYAVTFAAGATVSETEYEFAKHIISTIRAHYRQTYMIDRYFTDRMDFWEPRRTGVINNYDRFSPPSPLYSDYCVLPKGRHPKVAKRTSLFNDKHAYNWIVNTRDPFRRNPTAGTVKIVNQKLGIFAVSYPSLIDRVIHRIIPGALDPLPFYSKTAAVSDMRKCHLKDSHTMETIISVVWSTDRQSNFSGKQKYFNIDLDYTRLKGIGPEIEYLSRIEYARFTSKTLDVKGKIVDDGLTPKNVGFLDAIAKAEGGKLINSYRDRIIGFVSLDGYIKLTPIGNIKSIIYTFSEQFGLETSIDMREIPPAPTLEQVVSQDVIDFVYSQIARNGNVNEIQGA